MAFRAATPTHRSTRTLQVALFGTSIPFLLLAEGETRISSVLVTSGNISRTSMMQTSGSWRYGRNRYWIPLAIPAQGNQFGKTKYWMMSTISESLTPVKGSSEPLGRCAKSP